MSTGKVVTIGSRGSRLALLQDEEVLRELRPLYPDVDFQVVTVRTHGDVNAAAPLTGMGVGIFVKEIERELLEGRLNMAVHSLKDLPTKLPEGLALGAVLRRQDPRDVLVNRWHCSLDQLPQGARIGTSSPRRLAQLKRACPLAVAVPIRGNVETRIRKALGEECDGAILAAAGLIRLGLADHIAEYLSPQQFVPPPGQGALAVEVRADDTDMLELVRPIEHPETRFAVAAEPSLPGNLGRGLPVARGCLRPFRRRVAPDHRVHEFTRRSEDLPRLNWTG